MLGLWASERQWVLRAQNNYSDGELKEEGVEVSQSVGDASLPPCASPSLAADSVSLLKFPTPLSQLVHLS